MNSKNNTCEISSYFCLVNFLHYLTWTDLNSKDKNLTKLKPFSNFTTWFRKFTVKTRLINPFQIDIWKGKFQCVFCQSRKSIWNIPVLFDDWYFISSVGNDSYHLQCDSIAPENLCVPQRVYLTPAAYRDTFERNESNNLNNLKLSYFPENLLPLSIIRVRFMG